MPNQSQPKTLYQVLGVTNKASPSELFTSYRKEYANIKEAKMNDAKRNLALGVIENAYRVLSDENKKLAYDLRINGVSVDLPDVREIGVDFDKLDAELEEGYKDEGEVIDLNKYPEGIREDVVNPDGSVNTSFIPQPQVIAPTKSGRAVVPEESDIIIYDSENAKKASFATEISDHKRLRSVLLDKHQLVDKQGHLLPGAAAKIGTVVSSAPQTSIATTSTQSNSLEVENDINFAINAEAIQRKIEKQLPLYLDPLLKQTFGRTEERAEVIRNIASHYADKIAEIKSALTTQSTQVDESGQKIFPSPEKIEEVLLEKVESELLSNPDQTIEIVERALKEKKIKTNYQGKKLVYQDSGEYVYEESSEEKLKARQIVSQLVAVDKKNRTRKYRDITTDLSYLEIKRELAKKGEIPLFKVLDEAVSKDIADNTKKLGQEISAPLKNLNDVATTTSKDPNAESVYGTSSASGVDVKIEDEKLKFDFTEYSSLTGDVGTTFQVDEKNKGLKEEYSRDLRERLERIALRIESDSRKGGAQNDYTYTKEELAQIPASERAGIEFEQTLTNIENKPYVIKGKVNEFGEVIKEKKRGLLNKIGEKGQASVPSWLPLGQRIKENVFNYRKADSELSEAEKMMNAASQGETDVDNLSYGSVGNSELAQKEVIGYIKALSKGANVDQIAKMALESDLFKLGLAYIPSWLPFGHGIKEYLIKKKKGETLDQIIPLIANSPYEYAVDIVKEEINDWVTNKSLRLIGIRKDKIMRGTVVKEVWGQQIAHQNAFKQEVNVITHGAIDLWKTALDKTAGNWIDRKIVRYSSEHANSKAMLGFLTTDRTKEGDKKRRKLSHKKSSGLIISKYWAGRRKAFTKLRDNESGSLLAFMIQGAGFVIGSAWKGIVSYATKLPWIGKPIAKTIEFITSAPKKLFFASEANLVLPNFISSRAGLNSFTRGLILNSAKGLRWAGSNLSNAVTIGVGVKEGLNVTWKGLRGALVPGLVGTVLTGNPLVGVAMALPSALFSSLYAYTRSPTLRILLNGNRPGSKYIKNFTANGTFTRWNPNGFGNALSKLLSPYLVERVPTLATAFIQSNGLDPAAVKRFQLTEHVETAGGKTVLKSIPIKVNSLILDGLSALARGVNLGLVAYLLTGGNPFWTVAAVVGSTGIPLIWQRAVVPAIEVNVTALKLTNRFAKFDRLLRVGSAMGRAMAAIPIFDAIWTGMSVKSLNQLREDWIRATNKEISWDEFNALHIDGIGKFLIVADVAGVALGISSVYNGLKTILTAMSAPSVVAEFSALSNLSKIAGAVRGLSLTGAIFGFVAGTIIGYLTGSYVGAAIGATIGTILGGALGSLAFGPVGGYVGSFLGSIGGGVLGAKIESWLTTATDGVSSLLQAAVGVIGGIARFIGGKGFKERIQGVFAIGISLASIAPVGVTMGVVALSVVTPGLIDITSQTALVDKKFVSTNGTDIKYSIIVKRGTPLPTVKDINIEFADSFPAGNVVSLTVEKSVDGLNSNFNRLSFKKSFGKDQNFAETINYTLKLEKPLSSFLGDNQYFCNQISGSIMTNFFDSVPITDAINDSVCLDKDGKEIKKTTNTRKMILPNGKLPIDEDLGSVTQCSYAIGGGGSHSDGLALDIGADYNTPIKSISNGTIVKIEKWNGLKGEPGGIGNAVIIDTTLPDGKVLRTLYGHMIGFAFETEKINFGEIIGRKVAEGEVIGFVGSTGWSTGPHTHFSTRVNGRFVEPCCVIDCTAYKETSLDKALSCNNKSSPYYSDPRTQCSY